MIRFVFRFVGLWILAAGFIALVRDGTASIADKGIVTTALNNDWINFAGASREAFELFVAQRVVPYVGAWLWDPVVLAVLASPTFVVLGVLGSVLILIGRRKKPLIGYGRD